MSTLRPHKLSHERIRSIDDPAKQVSRGAKFTLRRFSDRRIIYSFRQPCLYIFSFFKEWEGRTKSAKSSYFPSVYGDPRVNANDSAEEYEDAAPRVQDQRALSPILREGETRQGKERTSFSPSSAIVLEYSCREMYAVVRGSDVHSSTEQEEDAPTDPYLASRPAQPPLPKNLSLYYAEAEYFPHGPLLSFEHSPHLLLLHKDIPGQYLNDSELESLAPSNSRNHLPVNLRPHRGRWHKADSPGIP